MSNEESKEIAAVILEQLGGGKQIQIMIGAHSYLYGDHMPWDYNPYLMFCFNAEATNKATKCIIFYDRGIDLYNVELWKLPGSEKEIVQSIDEPLSHRISRFDGIPDDNLWSLFKIETGLEIKIPTIIKV